MRMKTNVHFFRCTNARCEVGILKYIRTIIMESNACQMQEHGSSGSLSSLAQVATRRAKSEDRNSNEDVSNAHNRRELPSRRQPYRKVSSDPAGPKVEEIKEEVAPCSVPPGPGMPASIYQTNHGQFTSTGDMSGYQICTPTSSLPQGVVMAGSPGSLHSPPHVADETTRKRQLRLMKNREAARECRRKKKEYVKCLENRVAVLENQNRTLIEELKALKDIYCHKVE
ncbi:cyclic AMP response element-binding protein B isoform X3 [Salmo salar]|uniref:Cyclic AMP response element-binding protein B isoform X3 n=1 Tax=Salmo salar TaxID=8030 RepID=A0A1S3NBV9_SALSA|nr:cyclic AMP response element-binding protein B-like isoform X3 [Salmo salar]|eukprot:XP_014012953.1 PREDICTED: cyclic AMP response element-binding protein B-like isoform X3 [Salmo salar]